MKRNEMKISKRKPILTRYDGPRENVKRKEKSDKYKSENILVDFLERANTSAAHNTLTYKKTLASPRGRQFGNRNKWGTFLTYRCAFEGVLQVCHL